MSADRIGQLISGRYRVESLIGEGGMGAVYLAEHTLMRKRFALKLLHPEMADREEMLARFRREAEAAAHVEHPNIAKATDFGPTDDGAFFLVLEYVDGVPLRERLADGPLPTARALHIARQIALALECAHDAGVVHRDLKPENVMLLTKDGDPDFVKVLDFGVARFDPPSGASAQLLTQAGTVMGTPSYMAPEQAVGDRVSHRADLYSLGCLLYEMLTGKVPFAGDLVELLSQHVTAPVPPMSERAPGVSVPPPIEALVRKLLEKEASHRHPSARELVEAIDRAALESGLDVHASAPALTPSAVVVANGSPSERGLPRTVAEGPRRAAARVDLALVLRRVEPYLARANELLGRAADRLNIPKRLLVGVGGGAVALLLVVTIVLVARAPSQQPGAPAAASARAGGGAPAEKIRAAAAKGPAALEELSAEYPGDPAVERELAFSYDAAGRTSDVLRVIRTMTDGRPNVEVPGDVVRLVMRAASKLEASDEAFRLLEGPLGSAGVDALIELSDDKDVPAWTSARAQKSLTKPSVRANASPASTFLLDLGNASSCEDRHDVLVASGKNADARALPALHALESKTGCGRRRRHDCNLCLRKDDALGAAIEAAQSNVR